MFVSKIFRGICEEKGTFPIGILMVSMWRFGCDSVYQNCQKHAGNYKVNGRLIFLDKNNDFDIKIYYLFTNVN